jgi:hypothetical protein
VCGHQAELCLLGKGSEIFDFVLERGIVDILLLVRVCWLAAGICVGVGHVGDVLDLYGTEVVLFGIFGGRENLSGRPCKQRGSSYRDSRFKGDFEIGRAKDDAGAHVEMRSKRS